MGTFDGRFAPSPSGPLHLGNLRTALLAWLYARSRGARFLVRIEDLDRARCRPAHERAQLADLERLGLDWDEPPVRQSERTAHYRRVLEDLHARGLTYRCWCTRAEIRLAASAPHGRLDRYPGTCRDAPPRKGPFAWRLRTAPGSRAAFVDLLHGPRTGPVDDFVLWRSDGTPAYNLAVVVDDAAQQVGQIVRGDDLLATTPRQVHLAGLLGLAVPGYAHVPLVLDDRGRRLAKRSGAERVPDPHALIGWMAHSVGLCASPRPLSARDLLSQFDPQTPLHSATQPRPRCKNS
ncbi:MAG: tRNA glutamyl-Q(34) synthetase GluQRS [Solirubrobacteraceae bacterium]